MKARCENLEIHAAHGCNLSCESCSHYSNQGHTGHIDPETATRWFDAWSPRIEPARFSILGGEPTLNPRLVGLVRAAHRAWSNSQLMLVTNGFLLSRHHELPAALADAGGLLHISIHFDSEEYESRLGSVRRLVDEWKARYKVRIAWRHSDGDWIRRYHGWGPTARPFADGQPRKSWENCRARRCVQLHEGLLWKCPPLAYLPMLVERWKLRERTKAWDPYLAYRPLAPDCTDGQLISFLTREDEPFCAMCPARPRPLCLPSPLHPPRRQEGIAGR